MIVIICAAGSGRRLDELSNNLPKLLLKINGVPILKRVVENVAQDGVNKIIIVAGFYMGLIKEVIGNECNGIEIIYVFNRNYKTAGNMSSLWAARGHVNSDIVITVGDIIISRHNVQKILKSENDGSVLVDVSGNAKSQEDVLKVSVVGKRVKELKKSMDKDEIYGAACGFYKFKLNAAKKLYEIIENHFKKGEIDLPFNVPIEELCKIERVVPVMADGSFYLDIDTPGDLNRASEELKKIEESDK